MIGPHIPLGPGPPHPACLHTHPFYPQPPFASRRAHPPPSCLIRDSPPDGEAALREPRLGGSTDTQRTPHLKSVVRHPQASGTVLGAEQVMTWQEKQAAETVREAPVPSTVWLWHPVQCPAHTRPEAPSLILLRGWDRPPFCGHSLAPAAPWKGSFLSCLPWPGEVSQVSSQLLTALPPSDPTTRRDPPPTSSRGSCLPGSPTSPHCPGLFLGNHLPSGFQRQHSLTV